MKTFIFNFKTSKPYLLLIFLYFLVPSSYSQIDTNQIIRLIKDTSKFELNMDAVYNRPFLKYSKIPVAIGGYAEANSNYQVTEGVSEGLSFQMRRLTLFVSSSIHKKIKFLTEIEFEGGTKEINIEFAAIDIQLHHLLNVRSGIIMNPIGGFNQNHDGPKWEFIDRPISATQLLPATFSNVGFGIFGKTYKPNFVWAYEIYITNGFNDNIINNTNGKTFLPATKLNANRFEESFNGEPLLNAKTSFRLKNIGELGISCMSGIYNKFTDEAIKLDSKRAVNTVAMDFNTIISKSKTTIISEFALIFVDVPTTYTKVYGRKQCGGFIDIVQPIVRKELFGFEKASLNAALRLEYVDWNVGYFTETNTIIGDNVIAIVPAISFRPSLQTVIRLNYRYQWNKDFFGNPNTKSSAIQLGISSYF